MFLPGVTLKNSKHGEGGLKLKAEICKVLFVA